MGRGEVRILLRLCRGLKRRGFARDDIHRLRRAYRMLFMDPGTFAERLQRVSVEFADDPVIAKIVSFIRDGGSRPLMMPAARTDPSDSNATP